MQATAFEVSDAQQRALRDWIASGDSRLVQRAQVVLLSNDGCSAEEVSARLGVARVTVYKWRKRFRSAGLHGLRDLPRSGQPRKLAEATRAALVERTVLGLPKRGVRWSVRQLARDAEITEHQVRRIWAEHGLQPHRRYDVPAPELLSAAGWQGLDGYLSAVFLAPPHNVVVWAVRKAEQEQVPSLMAPSTRGRRLRRSVRALREGEDSLLAVLRRLGQQEGAGEQSVAGLADGLLRAASAIDEAGYRMHAVCSSDATLQKLQGLPQLRAIAGRLSALPMTCVWAEALENWFSDGRRRGEDALRHGELRQSLRRATRQLDSGQALTYFMWAPEFDLASPGLARSA